MSTVGYATLQVIPSMKGIESRLGSGLAGPMSSAGSKAGKTLGESTKSSFGSAFGGAKGLIAGLGLVEVASKVKDFFTESIAQARDTQKATAVTAARIKSTGDAAHVSAKQVTELGFALSAKTAIDHNVIQSGANMLLTFKNIGNEAGKNNDIFTQSTKVMLDLAASMAGNGQLNPKAAAIQLGKALNDPVKGLTSLTRVGVQFTDQQKAQITAMVKSGNMLGAQKVILKELNSEFKGTAAAQATAGEKMTTAWHNLQDEVGTMLLPTLDKLETFLTTKAIPKVSAFVKQMQDGKGAGGQFADTLHSVFDAAKGIAGDLGDVIKALDGMPSWAKKILAGGAIAGFAAKKLGITALIKPTLGKAVGGLVSSAKPVPVFVVNKDFGVPGGGGGGMNPIISDAEKTAAGAGTAGALSGGAIVAGGIAFTLAPLLGMFLIDHLTSGQNKTNTQQMAGQAMANGDSGGGMTLPSGALDFSTPQDMAGMRLLPNFIKDLTAGTVAAKNMRDTLASIPKGVATHVSTLGVNQTVKQIDEVANKYHLTPKQVRTILTANDVATPKINQVLQGLDAVGRKKPEPQIKADIQNAMSNVRSVLGALGVVDKQHPTATIDANNTGAMSKVAAVRSAVQSLVDHPWSIFIGTTGPGAGGHPHRALGGPITPRQTYIVGENGPELFSSNSAGRIIPNNALRTASDASVTARRGAASSPMVVHMYDTDGRLMGTMRAVARQEVDDAADFNRTMAGRR